MVRISEYMMGGDGTTQGHAQRRAKANSQVKKMSTNRSIW